MKKLILIVAIFLCSASIVLLAIKIVKPRNRPDEQSILALLYQQQAGEYRALCLQAYNLAKLKAEQALASNSKPAKPYAVITDLDETALDNSASAVWNYRNDTVATPQNLLAWQLMGKARAVPGAVEFFNYIKSKGITIFYISNRDTAAVRATMHNMDSLKFPNAHEKADAKYFLFKSEASSSKEKRRQQVTANYTVIAYLGDNLADMDTAFDGQLNPARNKAVDSLKNEWGSKYIMLPNATYGDWEQAFYKAYKAAHPKIMIDQRLRDSLRRAFLTGY